MPRVSERVKSILSFIGAIFFLLVCSLMFFPWFQWEEQQGIEGTVERLVISDTGYGSKPNYVVKLNNGRIIRVKAPPLSNYQPGDEIKLRLFTGRRNNNLRRYAVKVPPRK